MNKKAESLNDLAKAIVVDKNDLGKLEVPKSSSYVWNQGKRMFIPTTPCGREGMILFLKSRLQDVMR